jgi:NTE family protein
MASANAGLSAAQAKSAAKDKSAAKPRPAEHMRLPGQVVLVMQGGGAQGAYQGGVYQALHEAGIEPDWVIGTSIGAINGSIIAGNPVPRRLERLREFWSHVEGQPPGMWGMIAPMFGNPATGFATLVNGVPGFFSPNPAFLLGPDAQVGVERAAIYSVEPLKKLLPQLADFDLVNSGRPRFTLGLVGVRDSQMRYFDSSYGKIGLDHVLGSSAVPPTFPAVRIDGEAYWDGGIYSNTPVEAVFDDDPRQSSVVFAVQIWHTRGPEPGSVAEVFARQKDIMFGSRSRGHIARQAQIHRMRHAIRELVGMVSEEQRNTSEVRKLAAFGCSTMMHLIEINAEPLDGESNSREYDFSPATIETRWQAGYADTCRVIARRPWADPIDPNVGVAVYASDTDDNLPIGDSQ